MSRWIAVTVIGMTSATLTTSAAPNLGRAIEDHAQAAELEALRELEGLAAKLAAAAQHYGVMVAHRVLNDALRRDDLP